MKAALAILTFLLFSAETTQPAGSRERCALEGLVVKATTGEPVKRAILTLRSVDASNQEQTAVSDVAGRFSFGDLEPGRYSLYADREGYVGQLYGQRRRNQAAPPLNLEAGQHLRDVVLKLVPTGVITGRVNDEDGDPVNGATVTVFRHSYGNGHPQVFQLGGSSTNDIGEYRVAGLPPGQYYLGAIYMRPSIPGSSADQSYIPTYYPGTTDSSGATPLEVHPGEEVSSINFTLLPVRAVHVRGRVINMTGHRDAGTYVQLVRRDPGASQFQTQPAQQTPQGTFEFRGVPPGSYVVTTQWYDGHRQYFGRERVDVGNEDVEDVTVVLGPPYQLKGRLLVEGNSRLDFKSLQVWLQPREDMMMGAQAATIEADGSFVLQDAGDGPYRVVLNGLPESFYLKAARLGAEDVLDGDLQISGKQPLGPLELVLNPRGGRVEGVVSQQQLPFSGATVVLVPEPSRRGQDRLYSTANTDPNGRFSLSGIPPGEYKLFAFEYVELNTFQDPEFIRGCEELGKLVRIDDGSRLTAKLELIPADEGSPGH